MNASGPANFDRLARFYRALEYVAFGHDLERVRTAFLDHLRDCQHILIVGEGDGRFLAQLVNVAASARIHCIDASDAMLATARERLPVEARPRVTFTKADIRNVDLGPARYDAVTTLFLLDCFTDPEVEAIVQRITAVLSPEARWIFGDFSVPGRGLARWRARAWLALLYSFFRWQTGLSARRLPQMEAAICASGFAPRLTREFRRGLLHARLYRRIQPSCR